MKNFNNISKAKIISNNEQKKILGGILQPPKCDCFCYSGTGKMHHTCFDKCPDGSTPGQMEGNDPDCQYNFNEL